VASKSSTSRKGAVKDYGVMTDTELFQELARLYDNLLGRVNVFLEAGKGQDNGVALPEALEGGLAFVAKIDRLNDDFHYGVYGNRESLTGWNWGLDNFERKMKSALAAQALGREMEDDDDV